ncbi:MAG TPA: DegQ family serine endoprotease [Anaeromyxobacteraceae bacterium]
MRRIVIATGAIATALAIALGCSSNGRADPGAQKPPIWREGGGTPLPAAAVPGAASLAPLVKAVKPAVVNVSTTTVIKNPHPFLRGPRPGDDDDEPDFFRFFGPGPREYKGQSLGSGFVINPDGYVLTNNHVVQNASDIKVRLADGREFEAKVVGRDAATDVALLKLEKASGLSTVPLGDSDSLEQGDFVVAIGNPFGFRESVTFGVVSAKDRTLTGNAFDDFIQTDAAINQGNSGGPLFNMKGEVVGINTAIISPQLGQGLGFAVPVNTAKALIPQLLDKGRVARGYLGVSVQDLSPELAQAFAAPTGTKGALVQSVMPDSPASRAGVEAGDIVVQVNGKAVDGAGPLTRAVSSVRPGGKADLVLLRSGHRKTLAVTVAPRPDEDRLARGTESDEDQEGGRPARKDEKLGLRVAPLTPELARELRVPDERGVVVTGVTEDGPADRAGVRRGDLVIEVNRKPVRTVDELGSAVGKLKAGELALLRVRRRDQALFLPVKIGGAKKEK